MKKILVTGGTGFIGSALVKKLVNDGHQVRVLDNDFRGASTRIESALKEVEIINGDIRDPDLVSKALVGIDLVHHLAYINGTENFYTIPEQILEIAVKGTMNVIDGSIKAGVGEIYLASSSETYQTPPMTLAVFQQLDSNLRMMASSWFLVQTLKRIQQMLLDNVPSLDRLA